jgi:hypothetical protein
MATVNPQKYAQALVKNGIYPSYEAALNEAVRYNNAALNGLIETLKCHPDPDMQMEVRNLVEGGPTVHFVKNNKLNS